MRETMTETLRQAIDDAQIEARALNQEFVSTDHLLMGLVRCPTCEAARSMQQTHVNVQALRSAMTNELPRGEQPPVITGNLPLSPKAQRAINAAIAKAQALRESHVSTRFLLLALLDEPESLLRQSIAKCGGDAEELTRAVVAKAAEPEA